MLRETYSQLARTANQSLVVATRMVAVGPAGFSAARSTAIRGRGPSEGSMQRFATSTFPNLRM